MSLLTLPLELREQIYRLFLSSATPHDLLTLNTLVHAPFDHYQPASQPSLTRVNKQVRTETLPIFYAINTFHIPVVNDHSGRLALRWIQASKHHFRAVKQIVLQGYRSGSRRPLTYERTATYLVSPGTLDLRFTDRSRLKLEEFKSTEVLYVRGVTMVEAQVGNLWALHEETWLVTAVEMLLCVFAERAGEMEFDLVVDCSNANKGI